MVEGRCSRTVGWVAAALATLGLLQLAGCGDDDGSGRPPADAAADASAATDAGTIADASATMTTADAAIAVPPALPTRSDSVHCRLPGTRASSLPRVALSRRFSDPRLASARVLSVVPGSQLLLVATLAGQVLRLDATQSPPDIRVVLDLSTRVAQAAGSNTGDTDNTGNTDDAGGLRGMAIHPDYANNGQLFVHFVEPARTTPPTRPRRSIIARFSTAADDVFDPGSEYVLLTVDWNGTGHEGGPLLFDSTGMLLIALGDGGDGALERGEGLAQRLDDLRGKLLRVDVDSGVNTTPMAPLDASGNFVVPEDNPFVPDLASMPDTLGAIYARGFANPAACALDAHDGAIFCSDRSVDASELNAIVAGGNYGWPEVEGVSCVGSGALCLDDRFVAPEANYAHRDGRCGAVGMGAPAGSAPALLEGLIVHADRCAGVLSGAAHHGQQAGRRGTLGSLGTLENGTRGIATVGTAPDGQLLVIDSEGGVHQATIAADGVPGSFPQRLSETGCFSDMQARTAAPDLIPFEVRSPLWSDGTHKRRFMVVPGDARITAPDEGPWTFPVGTILVKEFALQLDDADPASLRPLETRFMLKRDSGWEFHGYRWDDDGLDAQLIEAEVEVELDVVRDGASKLQRYQFPGAAACPICHASAPGRPLGPRTDQLDVVLPYASGARNQLELLDTLALLDRTPSDTRAAPLPDPSDTTLAPEARARSYLHSNCAHCHQPGGFIPPDLTLDLRFDTPLADAQLCGVDNQYYRGAPQRITPGDPDASSLLERMRETGVDRMPSLATTVVDPLGEALVRDWISTLTTCP